MTDVVLDAVQEWTGDRPASCPWAAFGDPFVVRVLDAFPWFESGQLAVYAPSASHRLVEGVSYLKRVRDRVSSKALALAREERAQQRREGGG